MTSEHVGWEKIIRHVLDEVTLDPETRDHLVNCEHCASMTDTARELLAALEVAGLPEPSDELIRRTWLEMQRTGQVAPPEGAGARDDPTRPTAGALAERFREALATLVADSRAPAPALRTTAAAARMEVFEAEGYGISVSLAPALEGPTVALRGQVVPAPGTHLPPGGVVEAMSDDRTETTGLSALGEFRFDRLPAGQLRLWIRIGDLRIELPPIPCPAR